MQTYFTELPSPYIAHRSHKYTSKQYKNGKWYYWYNTKVTGKIYKDQMKEKTPDTRTMRGGSVSNDIYRTINNKLSDYRKSVDTLKKYDKARELYQKTKNPNMKKQGTLLYGKAKEADVNYNTVKKQGLQSQQAAKSLTGLAAAYARQKKSDEARKKIAASKYYNDSLFGRISYALNKNRAKRKYGYRRLT